MALFGVKYFQLEFRFSLGMVSSKARYDCIYFKVKPISCFCIVLSSVIVTDLPCNLAFWLREGYH